MVSSQRPRLPHIQTLPPAACYHVAKHNSCAVWWTCSPPHLGPLSLFELVYVLDDLEKPGVLHPRRLL